MNVILEENWIKKFTDYKDLWPAKNEDKIAITLKMYWYFRFIMKTFELAKAKKLFNEKIKQMTRNTSILNSIPNNAHLFAKLSQKYKGKHIEEYYTDKIKMSLHEEADNISEIEEEEELEESCIVSKKNLNKSYSDKFNPKNSSKNTITTIDNKYTINDKIILKGDNDDCIVETTIFDNISNMKNSDKKEKADNFWLNNGNINYSIDPCISISNISIYQYGNIAIHQIPI